MQYYKKFFTRNIRKNIFCNVMIENTFFAQQPTCNIKNKKIESDKFLHSKKSHILVLTSII